MSTQITSIGIGNMGAALATALLSSPTPAKLTLWNRTPTRPQIPPLLTLGATFEPSLATAIAASPILLLCVLDYPTLQTAFSTLPPDALKDKTIINLTNGTPSEARTMAAYCLAQGARGYYDGGVMVTPQLVGTAASFVIVSGGTEKEFREEVEGVLKPVGTMSYVSEDAGAASGYDLAALAAMYGMFAGAFTGMALLKKLGAGRKGAGGKEGEKVEIKGAVDGVVVPVLTALVPYVGLLAEQVDKETWGDSMGNPLAMQAAGVRNILQACEEEGVDGTALEFLSGLMERAVAEGGAEGGVAVVAKYLLK